MDSQLEKKLEQAECAAEDTFAAVNKVFVDKRLPKRVTFNSKAEFQSWMSKNSERIESEGFTSDVLEVFEWLRDNCENKSLIREIQKLLRKSLVSGEKLRDDAQEKLIEGIWRTQTDQEIEDGKETSDSSYGRWGDEFLNCLAIQRILDTPLPSEEKSSSKPIEIRLSEKNDVISELTTAIQDLTSEIKNTVDLKNSSAATAS